MHGAKASGLTPAASVPGTSITAYKQSWVRMGHNIFYETIKTKQTSNSFTKFYYPLASGESSRPRLCGGDLL
jgi:hypothetical protein